MTLSRTQHNNWTCLQADTSGSTRHQNLVTATNHSVCCCLVVKSCSTLCDPMDESMPGPPVFNCLTELGQIHVGSFGDTVQPSCSLSSPSPLAFPFSQHHSLFQGVFSWDGQSIGASASGSVLPVSTQGWFPSEWIGLISLQSRGFLRVSSSTTIQKHQFFSRQPSLWPSSHFLTSLLEKP